MRTGSCWVRWAAALALMGSLLGICGCGNRNADANDPDPNYFKGKDFHGRSKK